MGGIVGLFTSKSGLKRTFDYGQFSEKLLKVAPLSIPSIDILDKLIPSNRPDFSGRIYMDPSGIFNKE